MFVTHPAALPVAALYADDTQIYGACAPSDVGLLLQRVTACLKSVADWMSTNRLHQLNSDKTEFMWLTTARSHHRLPTSGPLIGSTSVSPSAAVRDLGVLIDQDHSDDEDPRATDSVSLLCYSASVEEHSSLHTDARLPIPRFCTCPQPLGLLQ